MWFFLVGRAEVERTGDDIVLPGRDTETEGHGPLPGANLLLRLAGTTRHGCVTRLRLRRRRIGALHHFARGGERGAPQYQDGEKVPEAGHGLAC